MTKDCCMTKRESGQYYALIDPYYPRMKFIREEICSDVQGVWPNHSEVHAHSTSKQIFPVWISVTRLNSSASCRDKCLT